MTGHDTDDQRDAFVRTQQEIRDILDEFTGLTARQRMLISRNITRLLTDLINHLIGLQLQKIHERLDGLDGAVDELEPPV